MGLLSADPAVFCRQSSKSLALPSYFVRNVILQTLEALEQLHGIGVIHTDIKADNIIFTGVNNNDVEQLLKKPILIESQVELGGQVYPVCGSQPIPPAIGWNVSPSAAEYALTNLVGLSQAQWAGRRQTVNVFSAPSVRAPEAILQSSFGPEVDIWSVGCLTFELLTGRWLFELQDGRNDWNLDDDHLAQMMEMTGERFTAQALKNAEKRDRFFDKDGNLRTPPKSRQPRGDIKSLLLQ